MTEVRKGSRRTHELFSKATTNVDLRTYPLAHAMREIRITKLVRGAEWWNSRISVEDLNDARTPRKKTRVIKHRRCLGGLREADEVSAWVVPVRRTDVFNVYWNSTGDPALRWEVARVWRLGRRGQL